MRRKNEKTTRVLVSMSEKFLEKLDTLADEEHRSRSELIREALRMYMGSKVGSHNMAEEE